MLTMVDNTKLWGASPETDSLVRQEAIARGAATIARIRKCQIHVARLVPVVTELCGTRPHWQLIARGRQQPLTGEPLLYDVISSIIQCLWNRPHVSANIFLDSYPK